MGGEESKNKMSAGTNNMDRLSAVKHLAKIGGRPVSQLVNLRSKGIHI